MTATPDRRPRPLVRPAVYGVPVLWHVVRIVSEQEVDVLNSEEDPPQTVTSWTGRVLRDNPEFGIEDDAEDYVDSDLLISGIRAWCGDSALGIGDVLLILQIGSRWRAIAMGC